MGAGLAIKKTMVLHVPKVSVAADETAKERSVVITSCPRKGERDEEAIEVDMSAGDSLKDKKASTFREKSNELRNLRRNNSSVWKQDGKVDRELRKKAIRLDKPKGRHFPEVVPSKTAAIDKLGTCSVSSRHCPSGSPDQHGSSRPTYVQTVREQLKRFGNEWCDHDGNCTDSSSSPQQSYRSIWPSLEMLKEKAGSLALTISKCTETVSSLKTSKRKNERKADSKEQDSKKHKPSTPLQPTTFTRRKASLAAEARSSIMTWIQNAPHSAILEDNLEDLPSCCLTVPKQPAVTVGDQSNVKPKPKEERNLKMCKDTNKNRANRCVKHAASSLVTDSGDKTTEGHQRQTSKCRQECLGQVTVVRVIKGASDDENELSDEETTTKEEVFESSAEVQEVIETTVVTVSVEDTNSTEESAAQQSESNDNDDNEVLEAAIESNVSSKEQPRAMPNASIGTSSAVSSGGREDPKENDKKKSDNADGDVETKSVINLKQRLRTSRKPPNRFSCSLYARWSNDDVQETLPPVTIHEEGKDVTFSAPSVVRDECHHAAVVDRRKTPFNSSDISSSSDSEQSSVAKTLISCKPSWNPSKIAPLLSSRKVQKDVWTLQGQPIRKEGREGFVRYHYASACKDGETLTVGDYVLMRPPPKPRIISKYYVGKVKQLFKDDDSDESSVLVAWCYRSSELQLRSRIPVSGLGEVVESLVIAPCR
jgi:hypothetical protein